MKISRRLHIITCIFVLITVIVSTTYIKSTSIFAIDELQNSTTVNEVPNERQLLLVKQRKLQIQRELQDQKDAVAQKKLEEQKKIAAEKKIGEQMKLEEQKKVQAQKKLEEQKKQDKQQAATKKQTSSSNLTIAAAPAVNPSTASKLLIDKISGKGNAKQAIVVTTNSFSSVSSKITTFENVSGKWRQVSSFSGTVGRNGFAYNKVEGDGKTPIGIFSLGTAFGRNSNPGTKMNYRQSTTNDFWVDDVNSSLYNTWQKGPSDGRWNSAENMYIPQYNYGFVINYNTANRIPGKGSAIFFHVGSGQGTAGCIATSQNNVISILKWLNPSKNPIIIEGPLSEVTKM